MATFNRLLRNGLRVCSTAPEHAEQLERLQEIVFPTLADSERFKAPHYRAHIKMFPEGQFVVLDGDRVVGMTTTIRLDLETAHKSTFPDLIAGGYCTSHEPHGAWMYGLDIGSHPDCRGKGVGRALYAARHLAARALGLEGQATEGMLSGYGKVADQMSIDDYYEEVVARKRKDPTVSAQMAVGFEPRGLRKNYLDDPVCGNACATLLLPATKDVPADWAEPVPQPTG